MRHDPILPIALGCAISALACAITARAADDYPSRAVRVIVLFSPAGGMPVDFGAQIKSETEKWGGVGRRLGVELD